MTKIYTTHLPFKVPLLLSMPHSGIGFPEEIKSNIKKELVECPPDTDWHLSLLYDFADEIGASTIQANYSRYVIDLNRSSENKALYNDSRTITDLVPVKTFSEKEIYNQGAEPDEKEVNRRKELYYLPYYQKITEILDGLKKQFGYALFWDCHSIKRYVPSIRKESFPDLILGSNDEKSADPKMIKIVLEKLRENKSLIVNHNEPFKGGQLTRTFGRPQDGFHALQLEMSQDVYMNEESLEFDNKKSDLIRPLLKNALMGLLEEAKGLK